MLRLVFALIALSSCSPISSALPEVDLCDAPSGWEQVANVAEGRFLVIGEMHGTKEVPAAFGAYVCKAAQQGGATLVGLEISQSYQPTLEEAKLSDDPRAMLLSKMKDHWEIEDGRSSEAMLDLVIRLLATENVTVHAFAAPLRTPFEQQAYERARANGQTRAQLHQARSERMRDKLVEMFDGFDRAIVLTGNIHAAKARFDYLEGADNLAMLLPDDPISLDNRFSGGEAWNMGHNHKSGSRPVRTSIVGVPEGIEPPNIGFSQALSPRFDGYLYVGDVSASPPGRSK